MNYHNITHDDMNNGDGLRVVLWLSGCSHHCDECQNPQTWNPHNGILFDDDAKKEIFEQLEKSYISGITLSGGDPLFDDNYQSVFFLCKEIKERFPNKTIWLYTGYTLEEILYGGCRERMKVMFYIDVLVDGEYQKYKRDVNLKWRGSSNQRVIDVHKTLSSGEIVLYCK